MAMIIDTSNLPVEIPFDCPYCGEKLQLTAISEWEGDWIIDAEIDCSVRGAVRIPHFEYPYIYWHPVIQGVIDWLNSDAVALIDGEEEKKLLEKWSKNG